MTAASAPCLTPCRLESVGGRLIANCFTETGWMRLFAVCQQAREAAPSVAVAPLVSMFARLPDAFVRRALYTHGIAARVCEFVAKPGVDPVGGVCQNNPTGTFAVTVLICSSAISGLV